MYNYWLLIQFNWKFAFRQIFSVFVQFIITIVLKIMKVNSVADWWFLCIHIKSTFSTELFAMMPNYCKVRAEIRSLYETKIFHNLAFALWKQILKKINISHQWWQPINWQFIRFLQFLFSLWKFSFYISAYNWIDFQALANFFFIGNDGR